MWESTAPVFMTAPQEIALYRGKKMDANEKIQMDNRIKYMHVKHDFTGQERKEVKPCGACGALLYLEGCAQAPEQQHAGLAASSGSMGTPPNRRRVEDLVNELNSLKGLKDVGLLDSPQFSCLKEKVLQGILM